MKSLAKKYRPKTFNDVVGNFHVKKYLSNTKIMNRIPQCILIHGKYGVGKTTLARIYAKYVNCKNIKEDNNFHEPCGECENCVEFKGIDNSKWPIDYIEINAADERNIDDMRSLKDRTSVDLTDLDYRIIIIDEAQQLTSASQNVLLKPLEDSGARNIFIFCTTNPEKIIPQIKSRCQTLVLRNISNNDIYNRLKYVSEKEKVSIDEESLTILSSISNGSLRNSIVSLEQCIVAGNGNVTKDVVTSFTNNLGYEFIFYLTNYLLVSDMYNIYGMIDAIDSKNIPVENFLDLFVCYLSDLLLYMETNQDSILQYSYDEYITNIRDHSKKLEKREKIRRMIVSILNIYDKIDHYPRKKHLLNLAFSECAEICRE